METNHQKNFFTMLKSQTKDNVFQRLSELLGLKKSAIYNKINGTNPLTFDEMYKIGIEFGVSFDNMLYNNPIDKAPFSFYSNSLKFKPKSYSDYLDFTKYQIDRISGIKNLQITYVSPDIPLVFLLQFPYLLSFKMYMWDITNWQIHTNFEESMIVAHAENKEFTLKAREFYSTYLKADTSEVIRTSIFITTYQQLIYCISTKMISNKLIIENILSEIAILTGYIEEICTKNKKFLISDRRSQTSNFALYVNDIGTQNELIYATGHNLDVAFSAFETPSFLRSNDPRVTKYLAQSIQRIKSNSIQISMPAYAHYLHTYINKLRIDHQQWVKELLN